MPEEIAEIPVATQTTKQKNAARLEALKAAKAKKDAAASAPAGVADVPGAPGAKAPKAPRAKKEKVVGSCRCGCGGQTTSFFVPGHDARFKGWLKKIELGKMEPKDLPASIQKEYTFTRRGVGFVPDKDYKGGVYQPQCALEDVTDTDTEAKPAKVKK